METNKRRIPKRGERFNFKKEGCVKERIAGVNSFQQDTKSRNSSLKRVL
jgi:hypothetical protein